jgi:hypothetical protein
MASTKHLCDQWPLATVAQGRVCAATSTIRSAGCGAPPNVPGASYPPAIVATTPVIQYQYTCSAGHYDASGNAGNKSTYTCMFDPDLGTHVLEPLAFALNCEGEGERKVWLPTMICLPYH